MNDLNELLNRASERDQGPILLPNDLLLAGKKRVKRRRALTVAGTGVVAAALVAAVAVTDLGGADRADVVDTPEDGAYVEVRISPAEVEERCTTVLNTAHGTDTTWVAGRDGEGRGASVTQTGEAIETREGFEVELVPVGEEWPVALPPGGNVVADIDVGYCLIPQVSMIEGMAQAFTENPPPASDESAIVDQCSRRSGFSLEGWDVVAASTDTLEPIATDVAVLVSSNGFAANCGLDWACEEPAGCGSMVFPTLEIFRLPTDDEYSLDDEAPWFGSSIGDADASGQNDDGALFGVFPSMRDGLQVVVLVNGTPVASATTDRGGFSLSYQASPEDQISATVSDPAGAIIWDGRLHVG